MLILATYHILKDEIGIPSLQLCNPAHAARPDHSAGWKVIKRAHGPPVDGGVPLLDHQTILPVFALEYRPERAAVGQRRGHVLEAVDEHVDLAREERDLELLRPERLAAEQVQRLREVLVALRRHEGRFEGAVWEGGFEGVEDDVGLDLG
jgi:hypothetical protein